MQFAEWRTDRVNEFILEKHLFKKIRYNEVETNSTFNTDAYMKRPETAYAGKMDSLVGKRGEEKKVTPLLKFMQV